MNNEKLFTYKFTCQDSDGKDWVFHHDFFSPMDNRTLAMLNERYRNYKKITVSEGV